MFGMKRRRHTVIDPFESVGVTTTGFGDNYGKYKRVFYSLPNAIRAGETRPEEVVGFDVGHHFMMLPTPQPLDQFSWELSALLYEFGRIAETTVKDTLGILGDYLYVASCRDHHPVGLAEPAVLARTILDSYAGMFTSDDEFAKVLRQQAEDDRFDQMDERAMRHYIVDHYARSAYNRYFAGL